MSIIYQSGCNKSTDFVKINGTDVVVNDPNTGYVGGSLKIKFSPIAEQLQSVFIELPEGCNVFQYRFKVPSATTITSTGDAVFFSMYQDQTYKNNLSFCQIRIQQVGTKIILRLIDPYNNYQGNYRTDTLLDKDVYHKVVIERTQTQWKVYLGISTIPILTYLPKNQPPFTFKYISIGTDYYNSANAINGAIYFDQLLAKKQNLVLNLQDRLQDTYEAIIQRYITAEGAVVRPINIEANHLSVKILSQGVAWALLPAVQNNDPDTFKKIDNWARTNLDRRNSTGVNTMINDTPTTALSLMANSYTPNAPKPIDDADFATGYDIERALALIQASNLWGSSNFTVDSLEEKLAPNYRERASNIITDLRQYAFGYSLATDCNYCLINSFQLANSPSVTVATGYDYAAAYEKFALLDSDNSIFWQKAIKGSYDMYFQGATYIFLPQTATKNLSPNWLQFDLNLGRVSGTSTYGDSTWGYISFMSVSKLLDHYNWYMDQRAIASIELPKSFVLSKWQKMSQILAVYNHDGSEIAQFQSRLFYFLYFFILSVNEPDNNAAIQLYNSQLANGFTCLASGSYFGENGWYNDFWQPRYEWQKAGLWINS